MPPGDRELTARAPAALDLDLLGARVRVETRAAELLHGLRHVFEPAAAPGAEPGLHVRVERKGPGARSLGRYHLHTRPAEALVRYGPFPVDGAVDLAALLNVWAVDQPTSRYAFHAGAVAHADRALLLPGISGAGKSTLTAALLQAGFDFVSDEIAAVDVPALRVVPYPRRLALRADVVELLGIADDVGHAFREDGTRTLRPEDLGARRALPGAALAAVLFPRHEAGAETRVEQLSAGRAGLALMECTASPAVRRRHGLELVDAVLRSTPCLRLVYSDVGAAARLAAKTFEQLVGERP